jgi:hypothetical protein
MATSQEQVCVNFPDGERAILREGEDIKFLGGGEKYFTQGEGV